MSTKNLLDAIGDIDDKYIDEYDKYKSKPVIVRIIPYGVVAACALFALLIRLNMNGDNQMLPDSNSDEVISYVTDNPQKTSGGEIASEEKTDSPGSVADNSDSEDVVPEKSDDSSNNKSSKKRKPKLPDTASAIIRDLPVSVPDEEAANENQGIQNTPLTEASNSENSNSGKLPLKNTIVPETTKKPVITYIPGMTERPGETRPGIIFTQTPVPSSGSNEPSKTEGPSYSIKWDFVTAMGCPYDSSQVMFGTFVPAATPESTLVPEHTLVPKPTLGPKPTGPADVTDTSVPAPADTEPPSCTDDPCATQPPNCTDDPCATQPPCYTDDPCATQPPCYTDTPCATQPAYETDEPGSTEPGCSKPPVVIPGDENDLIYYIEISYNGGNVGIIFEDASYATSLKEASTDLRDIFPQNSEYSYLNGTPIYCSRGLNNSYYVRFLYDGKLYTLWTEEAGPDSLLDIASKILKSKSIR